MITVNGEWVMEGTTDKSKQLKSVGELTEFVNKVGFIPYFKNDVDGFSIEEYTDSASWFSSFESNDPWIWREIAARERKIAYTKPFNKRAGFISLEWFPIFASYRRNGYDFDSLYEEGLASTKNKRVMDFIEKNGGSPSYLLREGAGFGKGGDKGFETCVANLLMQTYIGIGDFRKKINKKGQEYGWSVPYYYTSEEIYGYDLVRSAYDLSREECFEKMLSNVKKHFPNADDAKIIKLLK